jgi:acetyl-CoA synthetase
MANSLKALGAGKGDRVTIYLPMILEAAVAMLACARIGAVHSVVFGGFSPDALAGRIDDCQSRFVITADGGMRGGKFVPLKANVDAALARPNPVEAVIVVRHAGSDVASAGPRPLVSTSWRGGPDTCPCEPMARKTRSSSSTPRARPGSQGRAPHHRRLCRCWAAATFHYVFDYRPGRAVLVHRPTSAGSPATPMWSTARC